MGVPFVGCLDYITTYIIPITVANKHHNIRWANKANILFLISMMLCFYTTYTLILQFISDVR